MIFSSNYKLKIIRLSITKGLLIILFSFNLDTFSQKKTHPLSKIVALSSLKHYQSVMKL